jgi:hypothetical protein
MMSIDATAVFETYREAARHLRNTFFSTRDSCDWEVIEDFEAVAKILFDRLVLGRILPDGCEIPEDCLLENKFLLEPSGCGMSAMISREAPASGYWDHPVNTILPGEAVLAFREYFDWDQHGLIDFRYYRATIIESSKYPEIRGHDALIETIHAKVVYQK